MVENRFKNHCSK